MLKKILKFWVGIILATSLAGCQVVAGIPGLLVGRGAAGASTTYTVQAGDCLGCIAARYSVTTPALIDANKGQYPSIAVPSSSNRLQVGWVLAIPDSSQIVQPAAGAPAKAVSGPESAAPSAVNVPAPAPVTETSSGNFDYEAALAIVDLTNAEREKAGLNALAVDESLMDVARRRAVAIVTDYSHNGLREVCAMCGENINEAGAGRAAALLFNGWMGSEGHRANILRPGLTRLGVGVYILGGIAYATQQFAY